MAKVITFANQKGGVGKSTLTTYVAAYLQAAGKRVRVFDADFPQHSLEKQRRSELMKIKSLPALHEKLTSLTHQPFNLVCCKIEELVVLLPGLKKSLEFDYIFIDVPGTLNLGSISELMNQMDSVIIPSEVEMLVFMSTMETLQFFESLNPTIKKAMVWNKTKPSEKPELRNQIEASIEKRKDVIMLKSIMYDTVNVKREVSTFFPTDISQFKNLIGELLTEGLL